MERLDRKHFMTIINKTIICSWNDDEPGAMAILLQSGLFFCALNDLGLV
jgi:hypothetical protein